MYYCKQENKECDLATERGYCNVTGCQRQSYSINYDTKQHDSFKVGEAGIMAYMGPYGYTMVLPKEIFLEALDKYCGTYLLLKKYKK